MTDSVANDKLSQQILLVRPGKWDLVIIASLKSETLRFNTLRSRIGAISQKVLSSSLRELERNGFVNRTQFNSIPPRVEYELTEMGRQFLVHVENWTDFITDRHETIRQAQKDYDVQHGEDAHERKRAG